MTTVVAIDDREITITPVFKYEQVENIPKSEVAGHAVMETREMVEVRFAGMKNYSPMFPAHAFWKREGNRVITYAERWSDQYRAFKEGSPQQAGGTPLEMLKPLGVTPELISLCRALKIYSIEALYRMEGDSLKSLGMNANRLKEAAREFMADKLSGQQAMSEIEALKAEIAVLKAAQPLPIETPTPEEVEAVIEVAEAQAMSSDEMKDKIAELTGSRPRGNPSHETLARSLQELQEAQAV